jgi:hypothetical protein
MPDFDEGSKYRKGVASLAPPDGQFFPCAACLWILRQSMKLSWRKKGLGSRRKAMLLSLPFDILT